MRGGHVTNRKPARLKLIQGNKAKISESDLKFRADQEAALAIPGLPCPPPEVQRNKRALQIWVDLAVPLHERGLLNKGDGAAFGNYCLEQAEAYRLQDIVNRPSFELVIDTPSGGIKANPILTMKRAAVAQALRLGEQFGLTPAARARLTAPKAAAKDELEEFLEEKQA